MSARRQNNQLELAFGRGVTGEARSPASEETEGPTPRDQDRVGTPAQVRRNKRAPRHGLLTMALSGMDRSPAAIDGLDEMTVDDLPLYLEEHLPPTPWQRAAMGTPRNDQEPAACGHLKAAAGAAGRDREDWRGHTGSWHPHRARPLHPAGGAALRGLLTVSISWIGSMASWPSMVLQAAWDPTFSDASYGFRP